MKRTKHQRKVSKVIHRLKSETFHHYEWVGVVRGDVSTHPPHDGRQDGLRVILRDHEDPAASLAGWETGRWVLTDRDTKIPDFVVRFHAEQKVLKK